MSHDGELEGEDEGGPKKSSKETEQRRTDLIQCLCELALLSGIEPDDTTAKKAEKEINKR
jgi:hypothetical protein